MSDHREGDLWIEVASPNMTAAHSKFFGSTVTVGPTYGGMFIATARLNLSAFVRAEIEKSRTTT